MMLRLLRLQLLIMLRLLRLQLLMRGSYCCDAHVRLRDS